MRPPTATSHAASNKARTTARTTAAHPISGVGWRLCATVLGLIAGLVLTVLVVAPGARAARADPGGVRIVTVAKRYVHHARYVEGGASPRRGFDCSGYTQYVYAAAHVRRLPHNAMAQRHMKGMHLVSARRARPGDLVFYYSGRRIYHVAIYAGRHMQYAAATPRDGIRYQPVWSRAVRYGHVR